MRDFQDSLSAVKFAVLTTKNKTQKVVYHLSWEKIFSLKILLRIFHLLFSSSFVLSFLYVNFQILNY